MAFRHFINSFLLLWRHTRLQPSGTLLGCASNSIPGFAVNRQVKRAKMGIRLSIPNHTSSQKAEDGKLGWKHEIKKKTKPKCWAQIMICVLVIIIIVIIIAAVVVVVIIIIRVFQTQENYIGDVYLQFYKECSTWCEAVTAEQPSISSSDFFKKNKKLTSCFGVVHGVWEREREGEREGGLAFSYSLCNLGLRDTGTENGSRFASSHSHQDITFKKLVWHNR